MNRLEQSGATLANEVEFHNKEIDFAAYLANRSFDDELTALLDGTLDNTDVPMEWHKRAITAEIERREFMRKQAEKKRAQRHIPVEYGGSYKGDKLPEGSKVISNSDGSREVELPDGTRLVECKVCVLQGCHEPARYLLAVNKTAICDKHWYIVNPAIKRSGYKDYGEHGIPIKADYSDDPPDFLLNEDESDDGGVATLPDSDEMNDAMFDHDTLQERDDPDA